MQTQRRLPHTPILRILASSCTTSRIPRRFASWWTWLSAWTPAWRIWRAPWAGRRGYCCRLSRIGAGCWTGKTVSGTRAPDCLDRNRPATGPASSTGYGQNYFGRSARCFPLTGDTRPAISFPGHRDQQLGGEFIHELRRVTAFLELKLEFGSEFRLAEKTKARFPLVCRRAIADVVDRPGNAYRRSGGGVRRTTPGEILGQFDGKIRYADGAYLLGHD